MGVPKTVEPLPDSKIATYTVRPSGAMARAFGRSPSIGTWATACRVSGSNTWTVLGNAQDTKAPTGSPANATSAGVSSVDNVATTRRAGTSTMLIESEIALTTQASSGVRKRTETGSNPTGTLPWGTGLPDDTSNNSRRL